MSNRESAFPRRTPRAGKHGFSRSQRFRGTVLAVAAVLAAAWLAVPAVAQAPEPGEEALARMQRSGLDRPAPAPNRGEDEGEGPFERLVIRGVTVIDGTGAPPIGPMDIIVEGDRIAAIRSVGAPGLSIKEGDRPKAGDFELDAHGMYALPGFIDAHAHISNMRPPPPEYVFKLWLAHGVTTVRELGAFLGLGWTVAHKQRSAASEIVAPRLEVHVAFPDKFTDPEAARGWVRAVHERGADGLKFFGAPPTIISAAIDQAKSLGMKTAFHHAQTAVTRVNVLDSARMGLDSMEHWYGLPEALFDDRRVQNYPPDYNYNNEQDRFGQAGRLWAQAAEAGSDRWNAVMEELLALDVTLDPTFTIYEANRDLMRARNADWHAEYTLPALRRFFTANRKLHGAYFYDWTTADEIAWKRNFRKWMRFVNEYKNRGGRVTAGSDAGFIYKLFGFGYIRELELLQEAGFHPLEVIMAATMNGAELIGDIANRGTLEKGKLADIVLVEENPLANFKLLYGTGHRRLDDETGEIERVGGVHTTIKGGVVFDAKALLADVRAMVDAAEAEELSE